MRRLARRLAMLALLLGALLPAAQAQQSFQFEAPRSIEDASLAQDMHDLAQRMLPVYEEREPQRFLAQLSALQLLSGNAAAALDTRAQLQQRRADAPALQNEAMLSLLDLYTQARAAGDAAAFATAFAQAWQARVPTLDDAQAAQLERWLQTPQACFSVALQQRLDAARVQPGLDMRAALELSWAYLSWRMHAELAMRAAPLLAQEAARRYRSERQLIRLRDGTPLWLRIVRPRQMAARAPAVLEWRLDDGEGESAFAAAQGYVGVVAYVRGQGAPDAAGRRQRLQLFGTEARDATEVIAWIAKQDWSDGRVAMSGDAYGGYVAWAAAALRPPALKAIVTANAMAPGIDFPAQGRVYDSAAYRYLARHAYAGAPRALDSADWRQLDARWAAGDQPYYHFGLPGEAANALYRLWLGHPSLDAYWRRLLPQARALGEITIPALSLVGTQARYRAGALHYFREQLRAQPQARHQLLIGPYDDEDLRDAPCARAGREPLDTVARIDLHLLRYQWLDQVLRDGPPLSLLRGRVNVELDGANRWLAADQLSALPAQVLKLHLLPPARPGEAARLGGPAAPDSFVEQRVDLRLLGRRSRTPSATPALRFVSEPFAQPQALVGLLRGELSLALNQQDLDWSYRLYEQRSDGRLLPLSPGEVQRASYARDPARRQLLRSDRREHLPLNGPLVSRQLAAGSRLLLVLDARPSPGRQINYGSGADVSEESRDDAGEPLQLRWYGDGYIELPLAP